MCGPSENWAGVYHRGGKLPLAGSGEEGSLLEESTGIIERTEDAGNPNGCRSRHTGPGNR